MKQILRLVPIILALFLISCAAPMQAHTHKKAIKGRITYYHNKEDRYGDRVACSSKQRAKEGVTVAAHPDFKFGTELEIPLLQSIIGSKNFVVQDRGSAVTSKKASQKQTYVFDIYIKTKNRKTGDRRIRELAQRTGNYTDVYIRQ